MEKTYVMHIATSMHQAVLFIRCDKITQVTTASMLRALSSIVEFWPGTGGDVELASNHSMNPIDGLGRFCFDVVDMSCSIVLLCSPHRKHAVNGWTYLSTLEIQDQGPAAFLTSVTEMRPFLVRAASNKSIRCFCLWSVIAKRTPGK